MTSDPRDAASLEHLLRVQGGTLSNVLVLHGTKAGRDQVARDFHAAGTGPAGAFCKIDCAADEESLRSAIRAWFDADAPTLMGDRHTTLFLDAVDALSKGCQHLLLLFIERLAEVTAVGRDRPLGRLIAGSRTDLETEVGAGRFLPQLYDALNKVRVDLPDTARQRVRT